ncbi:MAG TPA: CmcI family methyltransferase [Candidatus Acidoferrales bacterium]|nr:CmcI family methyltransferase [Candidatus Acidoferrales bacterium]
MNDPSPKDPTLVKAMGADAEVLALKRELFAKSADYRFSYNFTWLGRPIIQYPDDLVALQEIIWSVKPDLIVETGIAHGGSLVFFASLLKLLGGRRLALGVDIDIRAHNRSAIESHPVSDYISMIQGSSVAPETVSQVFERARDAQNPLIVLDSNHTEEHVLGELRAYAPLVKEGSYIVVMDTAIEFVDKEYPGRQWKVGDNPFTAVHRFLEESPRFTIDAEYNDKLLLSVAPDGFLRCVSNT